ncbi:MAG: MlaD family protein [Pseudomonadota bacterium]
MSPQDVPEGPSEMVTQPRRNMLSGLSYVWIVPFIALLIALGIAWQAINARGPLIEVRFAKADGVRAETTELRFRDVRVGIVERLKFAPDMSHVIAEIRVNKEIAPFLDADAQFWIVRPQVSARGISGLQTVLSGSYIEGSWNDNPGTPQRSFEGLDQPPLVRNGAEGLRILLRAPTGSDLSNGAPILYRGVRVGHIAEPNLTENGDAVIAQAFIEAPHDRLITSGTRFWSVSGISVNLGAGGVSLDVESLATLVEGGVSFATVSTNAIRMSPGTLFNVYESEDAARESVFEEIESDDLAVTLYFEGSISGLNVGAPVELEGLRVGSVQNFGAFIDDVDGEPEVRLQVDITVQPRRLEMRRSAGREEALQFLVEAVEGGLRGRLANQGIFNPNLKIELVTIQDAPPAEVDLDHIPYPVIPTVPAQLSDVNATAEGLLNQVQSLPLDEALQTAIATMRGIQQFVTSDSLQQAPEAFIGLMGDAREVLQSEALQTLAEDLGRAADEFYDVVEALNQEAVINSVTAALERTETIMASIQETVQGLPAIVDGLAALTKKANELPLEQFVAEATDLVDTANGILASDDTAQIPAALVDALQEFSAVLEDARNGGLIDNANATLASASAAADSVAQAAKALPGLSDQLDSILAQTETVLATYGQRSEFNAQTLGALRDLREAARSVSALARTLERDPSALIRGR